MQKIVPHIWYDKEAREAAEFYVAAFGGSSKMKGGNVLPDTPSGNAEVVSFELLGTEFMAISAGPFFKPNPSISFFVNFDPSRDLEAVKKLDALWAKLSEGGKEMMPLQEYPFSKRYGWIQDKFGVSWQLILTDPEGEPRPDIIPSLLFVGDSYGKAEEALTFYVSVFKDSKMGLTAKYSAGMEPNKEGTLMFGEASLSGEWITAMDGGGKHAFAFNEGISLIVRCEDQAEIDYFWEKLSAVPEAEQCGWLKDKFGVSWQITPKVMDEMMSKGTPEQIARLTKAFLPMKKFDIAKLQAAYEGK